MNRFVIITPGRSGSTYLARTLNQHQEVECEEEVFNRSENYNGSFNHFITKSLLNRAIAFFFNRESLSTFKANWPLRWLLSRFLKSKVHLRKWYGFKLSLDQLFAYPQLFAILKSSYKVIYVARLDKRRVVLSLLASRKTGNYSTFDGEKISLDPVKVKSMIIELEKQEAKFKSYFKKKLEITTHDLFHHMTISFRRIEEYLSLSTSIKAKASKQVRPDDLAEWVENIDEIEMYLQARD